MKIDELHQSIGAVSVLDAGTLLGAVRQGAIAGRSGDVNIFVILEREIDEHLSSLRRFGRQCRVSDARHKRTSSSPAKPKLRASVGVDVQILVHNPDRSGTLHPGRFLSRDRSRIPWLGLSAAWTARIFDREFFVPSNYIDLLTDYYGPDWKEPTSRQFAVKIPKVSRRGLVATRDT